MKVLIVSSEAVPFAKTGGLADVCGALPRALRRIGIEADLALPFYGCIDPARFGTRPAGPSFPVPLAQHDENGSVSEVDGGEGVRVFLVRNDRFFDREFLYGTKDGDYVDNCERFTFFCRALMEWMRRTGRHYDVIHSNDWQAALIPAYLKTRYAGDPAFRGTGSLFTIHNLGYQGIFWNHALPVTGLGWDLFTPQGVEFYGNLNLMKAGLNFADLLSTVSPTYAREVQTVEYGYGLEGVLHERRESLVGILNGVDYDEWNPSTDRFIGAPFSAADLSGKRVCRAELLREFGMPIDVEEPVAGFVGRLNEQKGVDLIEQAGEWIANSPMRLVVLGAGERRYEDSLTDLANRFPGRIAVRLAYDNRLAHMIEAGSDLYLMPSRYEPCGLNQIYSLRYGTIPIVRVTGGLADTVVDADAFPDAGTGFSFSGYAAAELIGAIRRALDAFRDPVRRESIIRRGMGLDFSWDASARAYAVLYERVAALAAPK
ncbi:MAG TPA: glycogen synthase GlgA [Candidatus Deferrimicrobiaceae bacterium]|jgi:starch synthase